MIDQPRPHLDIAIKEETQRFREFYLWLENSMPKIFFKEVSQEWISLIVHSLMGFKVQDYFSEIHLKNAAIALCVDSPEADVQILRRYPMYGIKNYTTYISRQPLPFREKPAFLRIATTYFTEAMEKNREVLSDEVKEELRQQLKAKKPDLSDSDFHHLIEKMDIRFLRKLPLDRQVLALELFHRARTDDACQYEMQREEDWKVREQPSVKILLAWKNAPKHNFLYRLARMVYNHGLVMRRVNAAYTDPYLTESVFLLSFGLHGSKGEAAWEAADLADFLQELVTLKYFGSHDLIDSTFGQTHLLRGNLANFLRASMHFIHQVLVNVDPNLYSLENIEEGLCRHPELTLKLCEAFEFKLHPAKNDYQRYEQVRSEFIQLVNLVDTGQEYYDLRRKNILLQGMNFITHTLKTNFYCENKTSFCFRLDPLYLENTPFDRKKIFPELPFGIFFMKGMHFVGFHVRFKDLSRGGLRTVYPERREKMLAERNTVFLECYNLAFTQHKKNKDIPEGGAKGVIFLKPDERLDSEAGILARELREGGYSEEEVSKIIDKFKQEQKLEYLYQTQRSFIKSFLTLVNCEADGKLRAKDIVDYWKKPEYIYLGPDENMHNVMIEWIAQESKKVGYRPGGAFISGKPRIGINHKEYGVTSLGVNVYMEEVLKFLGIDPHLQIFTVKITGGTDGDVAGNQILNLHRFYPKTAKLLALTDVSGTINDPQGLDLEELVKLFHETKPIAHYPPGKLSEGGFLLNRNMRREPTPYVQQTLLWRKKNGVVNEEWLSGNEMNALFRYNVHQTHADVFIPGGGRPRTLNDTNYKEYFDKEGRPTSKAIVEGANLYLTPWARHYLEEAGVLIFKDSSANKGGVICSSFEILCGLTLTDEEFLANKAVLVAEILTQLQNRAFDEAKLLLKTYSETKIFLSDLSDQISKQINGFTDQLLNFLEPIKLRDDPDDPFIRVFLAYCPKTLREKFRDRLLKEIPENHKKAIISTHIASRLVYRRGLKWSPSIVDILPVILEDREIFR